MAKKRPEPIIHEVDVGAWLMTFSDLLTLLLAFFVLLLTMSSMDDSKFRDSFGLFAGAFGTLMMQIEANMEPEFIVPISAPIPEILVQDIEDLLDRHLREKLEATVPPSEMEPGPDSDPKLDPEPVQYRPMFEVEKVAVGLEVRIAGDVLFGYQSSKLHPRSVRLIVEVAGDMAKMGVPVRINSYVPPTGMRRDTAWQVSVDRAAAVANVMARVRGVDAQNISLMGYGRKAPRTLKLDRHGAVLVLTFFTEDLVRKSQDGYKAAQPAVEDNTDG